MAGPGIRYWEFAKVLGQRFRVKLIVPPFVPMETVPVARDLPASLHVCAHARDLHTLVEDCEALVTRGVVLTAYPFLAELGKPLVLDMYNPFLLEGLQREAGADVLKKMSSYENDLDMVRMQLGAGDFFMCANERQRDYWLGMLSAMGRVNPHTHGQDPTLRRLVDVVPFGLPDESPRHLRSVLKGAYKTIGRNDKVILWGGGIWNWLDAQTLIKAMRLVCNRRDDVKLFFMGIKRPNALVPQMEAVGEAITLSKELDLYERFVFFNDWVPYDERQNYLLEADLGVSLHKDHVETRFAFRTRLLDCIWTGLPVLATEGDVLGEALAAQGLAHLVAPGNVEGVAQGILTLLASTTLRADCAARFQRMARRYRWKVATQPLMRFCAAPQLAPDKPYRGQKRSTVEGPGGWRRLMGKGWRALRLGGVSGFLRQSSEYLRWIRRK
jgi:glycosyltransferase involved in cell wall biosynthesis